MDKMERSGVLQFRSQARGVEQLSYTDPFSCCIHSKCMINCNRMKTLLMVQVRPPPELKKRHKLLLVRTRITPKKVNRTVYNLQPLSDVQGELQLRKHETDSWLKR